MMQKFIIPKVDALPSQITIEGQDAKHIHKVLRLSSGDSLHLTDGCGTDYSAKIISISKNSIQAAVFDARDSMTESPIQITLCSGMLKDKKMDFIIKHVTQLGVTRWVPFFCERSIPSPDGKRMEKRMQRWETIAKESLKQCRRSVLPQILKPVKFDGLLNASAEYDLKVAFWEKATQTLETLRSQTQAEKVMILIGPEGGFSETEILQAQKKGFSSYRLGPRILRAETASISSCALIQHLLGDI